jgi:hypothetical protein
MAKRTKPDRQLIPTTKRAGSPVVSGGLLDDVLYWQIGQRVRSEEALNQPPRILRVCSVKGSLPLPRG